MNLSKIKAAVVAAPPRVLDSFYDDVNVDAIRRARLKKSAARSKAQPTMTMMTTESMTRANPGTSSLNPVGSVTPGNPETQRNTRPREKENTMRALFDHDKDPEFDPMTIKMIATIRAIRNMRKPVHPCSVVPFFCSLLSIVHEILQNVSSRNASLSSSLEPPSINFESTHAYHAAFYPLIVEECKAEMVDAILVYNIRKQIPWR
jgi:hypothetical protein